METSKSLPPITRITKYTFIDEVQQRSFIVMFVFCALCVFLVRGCYQGNYVVNGQALDAGTIVRTLSKVTFHVIGAGVMVITALLSMRIFRRDRTVMYFVQTDSPMAVCYGKDHWDLGLIDTFHVHFA